MVLFLAQENLVLGLRFNFIVFAVGFFFFYDFLLLTVFVVVVVYFLSAFVFFVSDEDGNMESEDFRN